MGVKLLCVCVCLMQANTNGIARQWNNDVYTGRQFDDYITQTVTPSPKVMTSAVLIIYKPSCEKALNMEKLGEPRMPPNQYMVMAKYDYETSPNYVWYEKDARDDLVARYSPKNCPDYLFFAKGTSHEDKPQRYDKNSKKSVFQWIWEKFEIKFNVINERDSRILIEFHGKGPKISSFTIEAGANLMLEAFQSYFVVLTDAKKQIYLHAEELTAESDGTIIVLEPHTKMEQITTDWLEQRKEVQEQKSMQLRQWRSGVNSIYLMDFKQPVMLPKFTELGYKKGTMPIALYKELLKFYKDNIKNRKGEENNIEPAINDMEVKCSMVYLSEELIKKTGNLMKPLMEEWSNVTLVHTYMYGIREYYEGNLLRNHVDRVTTHVVSVILQIDQDLGGKPDWELEVIGFDGVRKNMTLLPGEMLFYESATLIHGRPFPYKGKVFANAFLHYKPVYGWGWDMSERLQHYTYDGEEVENANVFDTPNIYKRKPNLEKFVERKDMHSRDEL